MTNPSPPTNLLDAPISFFEQDVEHGRFANVPSQQTTLRRIATTRYYHPITKAIQAEPDEDKQKEMKKQLPVITPVALLHHRKKNTSFAERIIQQWPMMMGDVDIKDNPDVDMQEVKAFLFRLPYILLCAYSVRGGVWFVVRLPDNQTPDTLAAHFRYLQKLFKERFGIKLDSTKGGNPTDLRFVACDENPYLNDDATIMQGSYTPAPPPKAERNYTYTRTVDEGQLLSRIVQMADNAGPGERHEKLLKAARLAGGYIAGGQLDEQNAVLGLETIASEWQNFHKSQGTIRDGIRYGKNNPIYLEERVHQPTTPPRSQRPAPAPTSPQLTTNAEEQPVTTIQYFAEIPTDGSMVRLDPSRCQHLTEEKQSDATDRDEPPVTVQTFHEWQKQHKYFSKMGLNSLNKS